MVKNLRVVEIQTINGEKHYVIQNLNVNEKPANIIDFDDAKIRRTMKKEASKPLLLSRAE
jgi:predicted Ser/Thr protein kinase